MRKSLFNLGRNRRTAVLALVYACILTAAFHLAYEVRFDFVVDETHQLERLRVIWYAVGLKLVALVLVRQLGTMMTYFSIPDLMRVIWAMTVASLILFLPRVFGATDIIPPRGVLLVDYFLSVGGICTVRLVTRLYRERLNPSHRNDQIVQQRIAIVGAGDAGASLAKEFINTPARGFKPVMFFDDNVTKHGQLIHGVPVVGAPEQILQMTPPPDITKVVIAMPSAPAKRVSEVVRLMNQRGYRVETLPGLDELAAGRVKASRLRPVEVQDLLGREQVNLDSVAIRKLVEGKVVMVTGAGGSIGGELCRQIGQLNPQRLLMVEQAESNLFIIEQEMNELGFGGVALPLVADILDHDRMDYLFGRYRPMVVFHAAAHKHVYLMERQPAEAFRNNVHGTRAMAELAGRHAVSTFVLISTDKAINPTSVMGATKRLAELQLQAVQQRFRATRYLAVRFGNVLGSSGSVIPIFKRQISLGGPVCVTHPDVTRYFMTIPEAVGLVLQTAVLGTAGGEIFVLDMGQPVKIVDLARQMIELSGFRVGEDIEIKFIGLKPGEKLYEELQHHNEHHEPTAHAKIMRFVSRYDDAALEQMNAPEFSQALHGMEANDVKAFIKRYVREYTPHLD